MDEQGEVNEAEAEHAKHEHAEAEASMKRLERLSPQDPALEAELRTLMTEIREHVAEENEMRSVFTRQELMKLGQQVEAVKKIAPTRPHPSAPDQPPGNLLIGLFDRLRDA